MADSGSGKPSQVFIVEDNDPDVFLVEEALRSEGVHAQFQRCYDGEQAVQALSQMGETSIPGVIIIDLNLPRVTGFEILRYARGLKQLDRVPVLILTSSQSRADRELSMKLGADAYIAKPPTLGDFLSSVGSGVRRLLEHGRGGRHASLRSARCRRKREPVRWRDLGSRRLLHGVRSVSAS